MLVSELLAGLAVKLAGLGLAAKATLGLGVATVAVTGAGAANVLPDPAQHAVATVVNAVSPLELPDPNLSVDLDAANKVSVPGSLLEDGEGDTLGEDEGVGDGDGTKDNHGACVSAVAKNKDENTAGREHGLAVSTMAKSDCGKENQRTASSSSTSSTTTTSTTLGPSTASELLNDGNENKGKGKSGQDNSGPSQNRGQGSNSVSGGSGRGNSGK